MRLGVERQRADVRALADRNGWDLVEVYEDNDITASKPMRRRQFDRMVAAVEAGKVDVVVAYSQSRLYRDTARFLGFLETCKAAGVESVALVADQAVNPSGSLFLTTVIAAKDAEESRLIGERVGRKHRELAEAGKFHGGIRPFGYEKDGVTVREHEAATIREAAERVLAGQSLHSIALDWNRRGVKTVRDRKWAGTTVKQTLVAPRLCGQRSHHGELRPAEWPAILPRDTWESVRAVLTAPGRTWPTRSRSHPLRGILACGECGRQLYNGSSAHTRLYQCRSLPRRRLRADLRERRPGRGVRARRPDPPARLPHHAGRRQVRGRGDPGGGPPPGGRERPGQDPPGRARRHAGRRRDGPTVIRPRLPSAQGPDRGAGRSPVDGQGGVRPRPPRRPGGREVADHGRRREADGPPGHRRGRRRVEGQGRRAVRRQAGPDQLPDRGVRPGGQGLGYVGMSGWAEKYVPTAKDQAEHEAIQHEAWLENMVDMEAKGTGPFAGDA